MSSAGDLIRILSWNVHGCVGRSGRFDPEAVARVIVDLAPDIVALQEVDDRRHLSGELDMFRYFGELLGGHAAAARTIRTSTGDYGHVLVSRWPLAETRLLDLSVPGKEPRCCIRAVDANHGLQIAAAHLGLGARERRRQLAIIRAAVDRPPALPSVILGDFNEWRRRGLATRVLCPPFREAAAAASFPARRPLLALDRIWCRAPLVPHSSRAVAEARHLSDHLPVLAELRLEGHA